jgi:peptidyl-tRNA hydrolase/predicted N-acetyltransferase YhbS
MRCGKQIAQGAHASMSFICRRLQEAGVVSLDDFTDAQREWLTGAFAKVCCRVDGEEELMAIHDKALEAGLEVHLVKTKGASMNLTFQTETELTSDEFVDVLRRSTLAERRPVDEPETIRAMLEHADLIVTARSGELLVGVSRAITDFAFCTYVSDLAVDVGFQKQGIGKELIHRTHEAAGFNTTLILLAAPKAVHYYPHIGMTKHESCWIIPRQTGGNA